MTAEGKMTLILLGLAAAGVLILAAAGELALQAERADVAHDGLEVAAWKLAEVMEDARRITRDAAAEHSARQLGM